MTDSPHARVQEDIRGLTNKAWDGLRHSQNLDPTLIDAQGFRFGRPKLLIWRDAVGFDEFEPYSLTVFQPFADVAPLARRTVWKRSEDLGRLRTIMEKRPHRIIPQTQPTIEVADVHLNGSQFETILAEASELRIPVVWPWAKDRDSVTTDTGMVGFEFYDLPEPQARVRCEWSVDIPAEWRTLTDWFERMAQWLDSQFSE